MGKSHPINKSKRQLTKGNKSLVKELNLLWDFVWRNRVADNAPGWTDHPDGKMPPATEGGSSNYVPDFSPVITEGGSPTLGITPGYIHIPKDGGNSGTHEVQQWPLYPYMPQIVTTPLDDDPAPTLSLTASRTNWVYCEISLTTIENVIGETTVGGTAGIAVIMTQSGTTNHIHDPAVARAVNLSYKNTGTPTFVNDPDVALTDFPKSTDTAVIIPWGKVVLDSSGASTTATVWYRTGTFDFFPQNYVVDATDSANPADEA